jgi:hypothetical protein
MNSLWNVITHHLRVQIGRNVVSMEWTAHGMWLRTSWEFKLVGMMSVWNEQPMACYYSHAKSSNWLQQKSVWNEQPIEYDNAPSETSNWSKRGQYGMNSPWNVSTHKLRVQIGRNEVSMEWTVHGMWLRTIWEFKLVETRSVWKEQHMECDYAQATSSNSSKRGQYGMNSPSNVITHRLPVQIGRNEVSM